MRPPHGYAPPMDSSLQRPVRPPRPPRDPSPHTPAHHEGPGWVSAPPPAYHAGEAVSLDERIREQAPLPPPAPAGPAPLPLPETPPPPLPALEPKRPIRCPRCATVFDWTMQRPTTVVCPSCGTTGRIG